MKIIIRKNSKNEKKNQICAPCSARQRDEFSVLLSDRLPLGSEALLYYALREKVPIIDAAVTKLVRLTGGFTVKVSPRNQRLCDEMMNSIPVGGNGYGLQIFTERYLEQLLTVGTAVGEIIFDRSGRPGALFIPSLEGLSLCRGKNGFDIDLTVNRGGEQVPVPHPERCFLTTLNPRPGCLKGESLLKGLPYISEILMKIYDTIGENWERAGALRYAVTYRPGDDPGDRAYAAERAQQIAQSWGEAMKSKQVRDFVAVGDVDIKVIGADQQPLEPEIPAKLMLEQIVAKTLLPPFMLGLSWSVTERMSSQQADALTSELESYRRLLTPVLTKIAKCFLLSRGCTDAVTIEWDDITLQDAVGEAKAESLKK